MVIGDKVCCMPELGRDKPRCLHQFLCNQPIGLDTVGGTDVLISYSGSLSTSTGGGGGCDQFSIVFGIVGSS